MTIFKKTLCLSTLFALTLSVAHARPYVSPENYPLAKSLSSDKVSDEISDQLNGGKAFPVAKLDGAAKKAYKTQEKENGEESACAETLVLKTLKGKKVLHICQSLEGNGCEGFYTLDGEFLNEYCGTESSEWSWDIN